MYFISYFANHHIFNKPKNKGISAISSIPLTSTSSKSSLKPYYIDVSSPFKV